jgi:hypothetical protein
VTGPSAVDPSRLDGRCSARGRTSAERPSSVRLCGLLVSVVALPQERERIDVHRDRRVIVRPLQRDAHEPLGLSFETLLRERSLLGDAERLRRPALSQADGRACRQGRPVCVDVQSPAVSALFLGGVEVLGPRLFHCIRFLLSLLLVVLLLGLVFGLRRFVTHETPVVRSAAFRSTVRATVARG